MTEQERIDLIKLDQLITEGDMDGLLKQLLKEAEANIRREGITLSDSDDDEGLRRMYTGYLYQQRQEPGMQMPRMLRYALNNRVMHEKGRTDG